MCTGKLSGKLDEMQGRVTLRWISIPPLVPPPDKMVQKKWFNKWSKKSSNPYFTLKQRRSYSIRCFFHSTHLTLISACLKDAKNKTKQNRLDDLKKHVCFRCKIEENNCYLCLKLSQGILKSIVQGGHVYFETEIEQY